MRFKKLFNCCHRNIVKQVSYAIHCFGTSGHNETLGTPVKAILSYESANSYFVIGDKYEELSQIDYLGIL